MEKKIIWTVDVEPDWGWRTDSIQGINEGLPKIMKVFEKHGIQAIYFTAPPYKCAGENAENRKGIHPKNPLVVLKPSRTLIRAHKFYKFQGWQYYLPYSSPKNHTGLLRHMWYGQPIRDIFYLHPFDIVRPKTKAPNLFCKLWYSQPERAYETFKNLVAKYS